MSEQREFNASSIEEALDKASSVLDLGKQNLVYRVLDEGSSGFLGLGARDARVMVETSADLQQHTEPAEKHSPEATEKAEYEEPATETSAVDESPAYEAEDISKNSGVSDELLSEIREHVETTLDAMAFEGEVSARDAGEVVLVDIESEDAGLLIGQKGETIDAMQYLVNVSVYRNREFSKKVVLDCGGYRERRVNAVQGMAHRAARRVVREGKAADLPPMSSSERRAVHSYLKDNPRVTTSSRGNDENRRVTISPA